MKIEIATEKEAYAALPNTFEAVEGEVELTEEQAREAAALLLKAMAENPDQHFFRIVVE